MSSIPSTGILVSNLQGIGKKGEITLGLRKGVLYLTSNLVALTHLKNPF